MTETPPLSTPSRRDRRAGRTRRRRPLDVVVIGGGITGTGIALDAATRGLSVVLVEKHDLAFGTSRWSSKLVHGGLRYLATGNVGIARRSAIERGILMTRNAPHLVKRHAAAGAAAAVDEHAGTRAGADRLRWQATGCACWRARRASTLPRSRRVDARRAVELAPDRAARRPRRRRCWPTTGS